MLCGRPQWTATVNNFNYISVDWYFVSSYGAKARQCAFPFHFIPPKIVHTWSSERLAATVSFQATQKHHWNRTFILQTIIKVPAKKFISIISRKHTFEKHKRRQTMYVRKINLKKITSLSSCRPSHAHLYRFILIACWFWRYLFITILYNNICPLELWDVGSAWLGLDLGT